MIKKKTIITVICDECGSEDVETKRELYNEQYRTVLDADNLRRRVALKSADEFLVCRCKNCGKVFKEKLGSKTFDLAPYEVEVH